MRGVLLLGAFYNAAWSIFLFYKPDSFLIWITEGVQQNNPIVLYQAIGVGIVGIFMFTAMLDPSKYRTLILLTFLAKLLGGGVVYFLLMEEQFTKKFMFHLLMNDLVWLLPLASILFTVYRSKGNA